MHSQAFDRGSVGDAVALILLYIMCIIGVSARGDRVSDRVRRGIAGARCCHSRSRYDSSQGYTFGAVPCSSILSMERSGHRLNVTLDPEHAARLARLAERTHVQEGTLARSLLSAAIEEADPDARNIVAILDGIPGAYEHAMQSLDRARAGGTIPLDEL